MQLKQLVEDYLSAFPDEKERLEQLANFLNEFDNKEDLTKRTNPVGHVTASGIILSKEKGRVLKMFHRKIQRYLQPGGHIELTDSSPLEAARREIQEETQITSVEYTPYHFNQLIPIDIDTHRIPENAESGEGGHFHHDFRYLFIVDSESVIGEQDSKHPPKYKWDDLPTLKGEQTFLNLGHKIDRIKGRKHRELRFYESVTSSFSTSTEQQAGAIVVTHLLPDVPEYLSAVELVANLVAILPKQKSKDKEIEKEIKSRYGTRVMDPVDRTSFSNAKQMQALLLRSNDRVVLFDIGGWFAKAAADPEAAIEDRVIGIIEDTENGHQKYEDVRDLLRVPVFSVARSPLKENEDFLVGQSILFSADAILREGGKLIQYMTCGILGYGKIGRSIAHHLLIRGIKPKVFDKKPHLRVAACNAQCEILEREAIIKESDVIFCATGQEALDILDFRLLKKGCFIFSVTSSDDEFNLSFLDKEYRNSEIREHVYLYSNISNHFFFVNKGNAVNFVHNAVLDDFIHLVRAEMLKAYECILTKTHKPDIYMLDKDTRSGIARAWLKHIRDQDHPEEYREQQGAPYAISTPEIGWGRESSEKK